MVTAVVKPPKLSVGGTLKRKGAWKNFQKLFVGEGLLFLLLLLCYAKQKIKLTFVVVTAVVKPPKLSVGGTLKRKGAWKNFQKLFAGEGLLLWNLQF